MASYAASRGLAVVAVPLDCVRHRGNAIDNRDERLVELAHAAVVVGEESELLELVARVKARGLRMVFVRPESGSRGVTRGVTETANAHELLEITDDSRL